jgi:glycosyltransferase involved in cell wall biosynthesis
MARRKTLLFLCQMFPLPIQSGTQLRSFNLIKRLGRRFEVTVLTLAAPPGWEDHLEALRAECARVVAVVPDNRRSPVHRLLFKGLYWARRILAGESSDRFYNTVPSVNRAIRAELARQPWDVVFCEYWFWDDRVFAAPGLKVIDANDVQSERVYHQLRRTRSPLERLLRPWLVRRYRQREAATLARADVIVATTVRDREVFDVMAPHPADKLVVPTGLDTDYFAPRPGAGHDPTQIVFYGALANPMNRDAVRYLVDDLLPRIRARVPAARLTIVGSGPPPEVLAMAERDPGIRVTGYVEDVRGPLSEAAVAVCPLRYGHGIRGRVFELMGLGVPVVATPVAVQGMELSSGDGLLLAAGPAEFADAVAAILTDPALRADLARRGRELVVARLSVAATYDRLVDALDQRTTVPVVTARP